MRRQCFQLVLFSSLSFVLKLGSGGDIPLQRCYLPDQFDSHIQFKWGGQHHKSGAGHLFADDGEPLRDRLTMDCPPSLER